jgi:signal transduction histidine kinase
MYKRLIILTAIIVAALSALTMLGYHAIERWSEGLEWKRVGEFAEVSEQVRQDVKQKLDAFVRAEEARPYTEYQYYYVPDNISNLSNNTIMQQQVPLVRSPLSGSLTNGLAFGYFQIDPDNKILTPSDNVEMREVLNWRNTDVSAQNEINKFNIKNNLLPVLQRKAKIVPKMDASAKDGEADGYASARMSVELTAVSKEAVMDNEATVQRGARERGGNYPVGSLQEQSKKVQYLRQSRAVVETQVTGNITSLDGGGIFQAESSAASVGESNNPEVAAKSQIVGKGDSGSLFGLETGISALKNQDDTILVKVEPFLPIVVPGAKSAKSIFGGHVYLLRHVQIEDRHFRQGFMLNEERLIEEVKQSAQRFMREGMSFELRRLSDKPERDNQAAYTAALDFGFGGLILDLKEADPGWIVRSISQMHNWYMGIVVVVLIAVGLGLLSLWQHARALVKLAQKKDDFISAVSHELRTPLTSIRMYSEMLEKNWVKSEDKVLEYYRNMRHESERLSRLIENVLDFSRIQKGRKKYMFNLGDLNECVMDVVRMMRPYAEQHGFTIRTQLEPALQMAFDKDSVKQIIINLVDNAVKYARDAADKTITVRTMRDNSFVLIEIEDHGPGVPRRQQKKVFEEFYRIGSEATRETTGTGLGLALVKRFAQAHNGFVEILNAKPAGAIFRVGLAIQS